MENVINMSYLKCRDTFQFKKCDGLFTFYEFYDGLYFYYDACGDLWMTPSNHEVIIVCFNSQ